MIDFSDLEEIITAPAAAERAPVTPRALTIDEALDAVRGDAYVETCDKCRGTGTFRGPSRHGAKCFKCKGEGKFVFRTSPQARAKGAASRAAGKAREAARIAAQAQAWREANPTAAEWLKAASARGFGFAASMVEALDRYGHLTEKQAATVARLAAQDAERAAARQAEREAREASAPTVSVEKIEEAFATARAKAKTANPKLILRLASFQFKPAPATGANAGAIYVTRSGEYLGKIAGGKFHRVFKCDEATAEKVVEVASDPKAAAIAYGRETGSCSCCGKELTNKESIELGIGPICASKWGL